MSDIVIGIVATLIVVALLLWAIVSITKANKRLDRIFQEESGQSDEVVEEEDNDFEDRPGSG